MVVVNGFSPRVRVLQVCVGFANGLFSQRSCCFCDSVGRQDQATNNNKQGEKHTHKKKKKKKERLRRRRPSSNTSSSPLDLEAMRLRRFPISLLVLLLFLVTHQLPSSGSTHTRTGTGQSAPTQAELKHITIHAIERALLALLDADTRSTDGIVPVSALPSPRHRLSPTQLLVVGTALWTALRSPSALPLYSTHVRPQVRFYYLRTRQCVYSGL
jgi:hypothetical protein